MWTVKIRDQTAHFAQSDHDVHCPQRKVKSHGVCRVQNLSMGLLVKILSSKIPSPLIPGCCFSSCIVGKQPLAREKYFTRYQ